MFSIPLSILIRKLFSPRCRYATDLCRAKEPEKADARLGYALCHYPLAQGNPINHPDHEENQ